MEDVSLTKEARLFQGLARFFQSQADEAPLASPAAFSELYEKAHLPLYRYIFGLRGGAQEDVEDLTAETFARAWKARHTFSGSPPAAVGWLFRIARSLVIDAYRRSQAGVQTDEAPLEDDLPLLEPPPEEAILAEEQQRLVWERLGRLPAAQREVLVLRYLLDWRVKQIGAYLEISENTVSVTIRRALARLQRDWPQGQE